MHKEQIRTTDRPARSSAFTRLPDHLTELLIDNATDAGRDIRPGRTQRHDGWTPDRIRVFLQALARGDGVADAARAAAISPKSAYALRNSMKGAAFARAWDVGVSFSRRHAERRLLSAGSKPFSEPIIRNGKQVGERHDNRRLMAALIRLDRLTGAQAACR